MKEVSASGHTMPTIDQLPTIAGLNGEVNSVQWWSQKLHPNIHYIVVLQENRIYELVGYHGRVAFNKFAYGVEAWELPTSVKIRVKLETMTDQQLAEIWDSLGNDDPQGWHADEAVTLREWAQAVHCEITRRGINASARRPTGEEE